MGTNHPNCSIMSGQPLDKITTEQFRSKEGEKNLRLPPPRERVYAALAVDLRIPQPGGDCGDGGKALGDGRWATVERKPACKMPTAVKGAMVSRRS
jgi:hypothetical protein